MIKKQVLVTGLCLGLCVSAIAQNNQVKHSVVHHRPERHKSASVTVPDHTKQMNGQLAKLEAQSVRTARPSHQPEKKMASGNYTLRETHKSGPSMNFAYKGPKTTPSSHGKGSSSSNAGPKLGKIR